jgi:hypothetical protein
MAKFIFGMTESETKQFLAEAPGREILTEPNPGDENKSVLTEIRETLENPVAAKFIHRMMERVVDPALARV